MVGQLALRELRNLFTVLCGVWMNQVDIAPMEHNESCLPPGPCSLSHSAHFLLRVSNAFVSPFVIYSKQGGGTIAKDFLIVLTLSILGQVARLSCAVPTL